MISEHVKRMLEELGGVKSEVRFPVGHWRFLSLIENPQEGDLGRMYPVEGVEVFDQLWTTYRKNWNVAYKGRSAWEFIRPVDNAARALTLKDIGYEL